MADARIPQIHPDQKLPVSRTGVWPTDHVLPSSDAPLDQWINFVAGWSLQPEDLSCIDLYPELSVPQARAKLEEIQRLMVEIKA